MKDVVRQTRTHLMEVFEKHGFHPRHDLGQNFLIDLNLISYIVEVADLEPDDVVLEVGAGTGSMTAFLSLRAGDVVSVEIDTRVHQLAKEAVEGRDNVTLLHCDALKNKNNFAPQVLETLQEKLAKSPNRRLKLVANLPYCIATPVMSNLVASELPWTQMISTIQWELADKMRSPVGTDGYGALAVMMQAQGRVKILKKLNPTVFWPRPTVDSAIIRVTRDTKLQAKIHDREFFQDFVRRCFSHRRKHLRSVLIGMYNKQLDKPDIDAILKPFGFTDGARAENMEPDILVRVSNAVQAFIGVKTGQPPVLPVDIDAGGSEDTECDLDHSDENED